MYIYIAHIYTHTCMHTDNDQYMCMCVICVFMCINRHIYPQAYLPMYNIYVCMYIYRYTQMSASIHTYMHAYICWYMHTHSHVCLSIYIPTCRHSYSIYTYPHKDTCLLQCIPWWFFQHHIQECLQLLLTTDTSINNHMILSYFLLFPYLWICCVSRKLKNATT